MQTWQQGVGTTAELVEAASHAAAKQAAQAADALHSGSQQLQDAAQNRTEGLQEAVTQSFEAAAGRLGAIIPQVPCSAALHFLLPCTGAWALSPEPA